jgi:hypothetical protein
MRLNVAALYCARGNNLGRTFDLLYFMGDSCVRIQHCPIEMPKECGRMSGRKPARNLRRIQLILSAAVISIKSPRYGIRR